MDINFILSHECSNPSSKYPGYNEYHLEGCCCSYEIHARLTSGEGSNEDPFIYEIKDLVVRMW